MVGTFEQPPAFYVPEGPDDFRSTRATTSPWDARQQHGGPPSALLARTIQACEPRADMAISRISIDFLGPIPQGLMQPRATVVRPGKRIELVEARLDVDGRCVAVARAWRSRVEPDSVPPVADAAFSAPALPEPQPQRYFNGVDEDWGYGRAIEWRFVAGGFHLMGPAIAWARPLIPLIAGQSPSGLERTLLVADSINGLSATLEIADWLFIPPTLTVTVIRDPVDEWLLLDARTRIDSRGMGLAHATLADRVGEFGMATQPLLVQRH